MRFIPVTVFVGLCAIAQSHFILQIPTAIGFDDENEGIAPCGGFNARDRTSVSNFKVKGSAIGLLTTHLDSQYEFKVALLSNLNHWESLTRVLHQEGVGEFCEPDIPGKKSWIGKKVVLQVVQHGDDGDLFQCAAIKFVAGGPAGIPSACTNDTGTSAEWL